MIDDATGRRRRTPRSIRAGGSAAGDETTAPATPPEVIDITGPIPVVQPARTPPGREPPAPSAPADDSWSRATSGLGRAAARRSARDWEAARAADRESLWADREGLRADREGQRVDRTTVRVGAGRAGARMPAGRVGVGGDRPPTLTAAGGEERLRLLLDGTQDHAIVMLGPQGMVLTWSEAARRILGHTAGDIIGQSFTTFSPREAVEAGHPQRVLSTALRTGRHEEEGWQVRKDGTRFWANVVITPLRDRTGRLRGFGQVTRDLTAHHRGEQLLAVLEAAADAILGVDAAGRVMFANAAVERLFGYDRSELVGRSVDVLVPAVSRAAHLAHHRDHPAGTGPRTVGDGLDVTAVRKDGSEFPAEVSLSAVDTERGPVTTATVRDLTSRLAAAEAVRASQERLRALVDHSPVALAEAGLDAVIRSANTAMEEMLGFGPGELVGVSWQDLVAPEDQPRQAEDLRALLGSRRPYYEGQRVLVGRDGRRVTALVSASLVLDADGQPCALAGCLVDITEREKARRALQRREEQLAAAQQVAGLGSWEVEDDGTVTWSDEMHRLLGLEPGEVAPGRLALMERLHPDDGPRLAELFATAESPEAVGDARVVDASGRVVRTVEVRAGGRIAADGRVRWTRGTLLDVTRTRALERSLRDSRDVFAGILEAGAEQAVIVTDAAGHITMFNRGAERLLGYRADEVLGRRMPARLHLARELEEVAAELGMAPGSDPFLGLLQRGLPDTRAWTLVDRDGFHVRVSMTLAVVGEPDAPGGFVAVATDLAARPAVPQARGGRARARSR